MSNPNALFLLADHIKLSLLERKRAQSLNLDSDTQDGHISRSLEQFKDGLEALHKEQKRLEDAGDDDKALNIADSLPALQKQYNDLTSQFHGFSTPSSSDTLTHPNDPALAPDFVQAKTVPAAATAPSSATVQSQPAKKSLRTGAGGASQKTVRFSDNPSSNDLEAQAAGGAEASPADPSAQLFGPYRDDPDGTAGYRDQAQDLSNVQIHAYHQQIMADQDAQLDALGDSISRQRELSMRIGDELDEQVLMLDESERVTDRHQNTLDRARRQVGRIARGAGESKSMVTIIVLIIILVLLIIVLK